MLTLIIGIVTFSVTAWLFWLCLPDGEKRYRFADTEWDSYIGVGFAGGFALSVMAIISGTVALFA